MRLADGDREAFAAVYAVVWPTVQRFAARALAGCAEGDDAAQSALLKIFSRVAEFDTERDALAWILGIVAWECRTLRRRAQRRREEPIEHADRVGVERTPEDEMIRCDLEAAAREVIESLRPVDVETLRLVASGEHPTNGAATFRKRVERALARARAAWSSKHGT